MQGRYLPGNFPCTRMPGREVRCPDLAPLRIPKDRRCGVIKPRQKKKSFANRSPIDVPLDNNHNNTLHAVWKTTTVNERQDSGGYTTEEQFKVN